MNEANHTTLTDIARAAVNEHRYELADALATIVQADALETSAEGDELAIRSAIWGTGQ